MKDYKNYVIDYTHVMFKQLIPPKHIDNNKIEQKTLTLVVEDDLFFNKLVFVWEWVFVSVGAVVVVVVVPDAFVTWSAGNDSGTVCNVGLIVADILKQKVQLSFLFYLKYVDFNIRKLIISTMFINTE